LDPDPCAIESTLIVAMHHVLEDIDECFARAAENTGGVGGCLSFVFTRMRLTWAAATTYRSRCERVLCKDRRCEKKDCGKASYAVKTVMRAGRFPVRRSST